MRSARSRSATWRGSSISCPPARLPEWSPQPKPHPLRSVQNAEGRTIEIAFWNSARAANDCEAIRAYLKRYPKGFFVDLGKLSETRLCVDDGNARPAEAAAPPT